MVTADPRQFWDARYGEADFAYGEQPNDVLREQAAALPPGRSLCLAEGEGRNAVHLAQLGQTVLAQDLSSVGLSKAQQLAASRGGGHRNGLLRSGGFRAGARGVRSGGGDLDAPAATLAR